MIEFYPAGCKLNPPNVRFCPWVYFHREMNEIIEKQWNDHPEREAPDLAESLTNIRELEKGIYDCVVQGIPAKFILWYSSVTPDPERKIPRGYIMTADEFNRIWDQPDCHERENYEDEGSCI